MITVFYDGKCGLCAKEINHYRKIAPNGLFDWQDITESVDKLNEEGITLAQGLQLLHVKDDNGTMHVGVDAFIVIWMQLKRWNVLATVVSLPLIKPITNWCYAAFANRRFKRLTHCQLAQQHEKTK